MTLMADIQFILPELVLTAGALIALMVGVFKKQDPLSTTIPIAVIVLLAAFTLNRFTPQDSQTLFNDFLLTDAYAIVVKAFLLIFASFILVNMRRSLASDSINQFEYPILIMLSVLGMMIMVSSFNLLTLFLGLELQSLSLYVLTALKRDDAKASEAGLKYFILGALSTGLLLYGISFIYGLTGSLNFHDIAIYFAKINTYPTMLYVALIMISAGLLFKISVAPFHMWTPDVYEGAPISVVTFLSTVPKIAAVALISRVFAQPLSEPLMWINKALIIFAVISMILGVFGALYQTNIKRLIAYSSIANMGYVMIGFIVNTAYSVQAALLYVIIYTATIMGFFMTLLCLRQRGFQIENIRDLTGVGKQEPGLGFALGFLLFSLAGIPPLAGFLGKLYIFEAAVQGHHLIVAIIGVLTSVVAAAYYLWILKVAVIDEKEMPSQGQTMVLEKTATPAIIVVILIVSLTTIFAKPNLILELFSVASSSLFIGR